MNVLLYRGIAEGQFPLAVTPSTNCTFLASRDLTFATEIIPQLGQKTPLHRSWEIVGGNNKPSISNHHPGTTLSNLVHKLVGIDGPILSSNNHQVRQACQI